MVRQTSIMLLVLFCFVYPMISYGVSIVVNTTYSITVTDRIMEKKRFNLQAPPVYDRKVTNLFFSIIIFSIIIFPIILSVTVLPSIRNLNAF